jgi:DNA recombination protein RmuC
METVILLALLLSAIALALTLAARRSSGGDMGAVRDELRALRERMGAETTLLGQRLEGIDSRMCQTQAQGNDMAATIFETLGDVRRHTAAVAEQAREFSSLQDLLRAPTARGGLGEALLEELLRQVLPPRAYQTQHRFSTGVTVDAVVRMGTRCVCIDSKFPLANYRRMCDAADAGERTLAERAFAADVQGHILDIARRYVVPDEGTLDFAVMYVPAEGLYAEVLRLAYRKRPLFETAIEARVVPMSPLTLYGYLQTILFGLRCLSIERSAEKVLGFCGRLQQDMERFAEEYETLGRHIGHARSKHEDGARRLDRLRDRLERVSELSEDTAAGTALDAVPH